MKTVCHSNHNHPTKLEARACDVKLLALCLAAMAWARDKLLKEVRNMEDDGEIIIHPHATMRAVAHALDVTDNPRLKA